MELKNQKLLNDLITHIENITGLEMNEDKDALKRAFEISIIEHLHAGNTVYEYANDDYIFSSKMLRKNMINYEKI